MVVDGQATCDEVFGHFGRQRIRQHTVGKVALHRSQPRRVCRGGQGDGGDRDRLGWGHMLRGNAPGDGHFIQQLGQRRDVVVALDHRGHSAKTLAGLCVQVPHRLRHRVVVRVDDVVAVVAVPSQVNLLHPVRGQGMQIGQWVESMVHAAHVDVVHIHQQQAVGLLRDVGQKLPLARAVMPVADIARHVLQHQPASQHILCATDLCDHMACRFVGVGQRVQVVQLLGARARPAQVVGHPQRLDTVSQGLHALQIRHIHALRRTDGHGHAMHGHGVVAPDGIDHRQRFSTVDEVVVGDDFQPVERLLAREEIGVVLRAQSQAKAGAARSDEVMCHGEIKVSKCGHWA